MVRDRFVPVCLSSFLVTAALLSPSVVRAEQAAPAPFQVVRVGDRTMTCEALAGEINALAQAPAMTQAQAKPKKKRGLGFLSMLGGAVPFAGGVTGALVSTAASGAAQAAANGASDAAMMDAQRAAFDAMNGGSPEQQRRERLTAIFEEKSC